MNEARSFQALVGSLAVGADRAAPHELLVDAMGSLIHLADLGLFPPYAAPATPGVDGRRGDRSLFHALQLGIVRDPKVTLCDDHARRVGGPCDWLIRRCSLLGVSRDGETTARDNAVRLTVIMLIGLLLGSKIKGRFGIVVLRTP
jgi:hypothetical protein